ncbi:MAG TPA: ROK family protein [Rhodopila sp.]|uniref:ROK family protein n=1 Tax=Rhodopila sp. TaxID=2480087 RepID=UPI002BE9C2D2|nr:ROK family protein [Rhodopila sp.]HVY17685.1 ROK family protein [Rhodopila sp.]
MDSEHLPAERSSPLTLAIDIGGTHLKAGLLDASGQMVKGPDHVDTPHDVPPKAIVDKLVELAKPLGRFDRVSVGFPGVVRHGYVLTAPNLGTKAWRNFPLASALMEKLDKPVRMLNDAEVQGLGVITGKGLECVITLGTGMGFALFEDGRPAPHLELSQHPVHKGKTYDQFLGVAAFKAVGRKRWNKRLQRALDCITTLVGYDTLYIGGGNAKQVDLTLPANVKLVSNDAGITGGVRLWGPALDPVFS